MARAPQRKSCARFSQKPSPSGSSPTPSSSSTPSPAPPSANSKNSPSANNSPTGSGSLKSHYRVPNEDFVLVALSFLGRFQADRLYEIVQRLNDGGISTIEIADPFFWDRLVRGKGLQNAGSQ